MSVKLTIGDISQYINRGIAPKYTESIIDSVVVINQRCIRDFQVSLENARLNDIQKRKVSEDKLIYKYDVLINSTGVGTLGRVAQYVGNSKIATVDSHVTIIRPDENKIDPIYFGYLLKSKQHIFEKLGQGTTGQTELSRTTVSELEICFIKDRSHQKAVGIFLHNIDEKIQINTRINQNLEAMSQAIFKSWFVDFDSVRAKRDVLANGGSIDDAERASMCVISSKTADELVNMENKQPEEFSQLKKTASLFPSEFIDSELGEIPKDWEVGQLKDVCSYTNERTFLEELTVNNYISTESMLENKQGITTAAKLPNVKTVPRVKEGDILISNIRPYFKKIWFANFEGGRSADVLGFESVNKEQKEFVYNLLFQDVFFDFMMQTSKGAKMPRGDKEAIMKMQIAIPSFELIAFYSQKIESIYPQISQFHTQNKTLAELRDTLLPKLLSGQLDVSLAGVCNND